MNQTPTQTESLSTSTAPIASLERLRPTKLQRAVAAGRVGRSFLLWEIALLKLSLRPPAGSVAPDKLPLLALALLIRLWLLVQLPRALLSATRSGDPVAFELELEAKVSTLAERMKL